MPVLTNPRPAGPRPGAPAGALAGGIAAFALIELSLALFMAFAPHAFYVALGPFDAFNAHYLRDVASFEGAIGIALLVALRRPSWRVPVLALTTVQFALHSFNHLLDIGSADPRWTGYADFGSLVAVTLLLAWLWRLARNEGSGAGRPLTAMGGRRSATGERSGT